MQNKKGDVRINKRTAININVKAEVYLNKKNRYSEYVKKKRQPG